ncbi:MAG TPA: hypothetical protein P5239_07525, partial [Victivallales bacterium]|nr:hypothetical protein [Victivallales bacterium]
AVCVNKYDINERVAKEIINFVNSTKLVTYFCRISYDKNATAAQINGKTIVEYADSLVSREIKKIWNDIQFYLSN